MKRTSLVDQTDKIFRHTRQGSIETREGYHDCMLRFVRWLDENYKLQNLRNISNKHLAAYAKMLLEEGRKASYVKKMMSAIRYYHDQLSRPRYQLERSNEKLGIPDRVPPGDRSWSVDEYELLCEIANKSGKEWIADVLTLQLELGCRIHEVIRLDTVAVERMLRDGRLKLVGKGGKERMTIPASGTVVEILVRAKARVSRGAKLFVAYGQLSHVVIKEVQDFIRNNRPDREGEALTSHGLRYKYAQTRMVELEDKMPRARAESILSKEMGHNRRSIVRGYLGKR